MFIMTSPIYLSTVPFASLKIVVRRISFRTKPRRQVALEGVEPRLQVGEGEELI